MISSKDFSGVVSLHRKKRISHVVSYLKSKGFTIKGLVHVSTKDKITLIKEWEKSAFHDYDWNLFIKFTDKGSGGDVKQLVEKMIRIKSCSSNKAYDYYLIKQ